MKTAVLLTLLIVSALFMGCTTDPCKSDCCCGQMKANCCGWEFYKPCRMLRSDSAAWGCDSCPTEIVLKDCEVLGAGAEPEVDAAMMDEGSAGVEVELDAPAGK